MNKLVAIVNVIAWAGFWAFGYLAISAQGLSERQIVIAMGLAFVGLATGVWAYMRLIRHTEKTGYAKRPGVLDSETRARAQDQWARDQWER
ncbi:MAG: hypothetical protein CML66_08170 [Rhodobacteraceae bacterium]|nr:hypothetical protein [Paracoccaceae bacterium]MAY46043.1 hypothetical protein [Paracoccaceae bacterium]|tara:strand:+ start:187 stop:459 length:273 start_codon:yes stop_codon:yes gene_type:complete